MTEVITSLGGGTLFALRFKVWTLLAALLVAAVIAGICGITWPNAVLLMLLTSAAVQLGYFSACC